MSVVALSFAIVLTLTAAALLSPTYILLIKSISAKETRLASIESTLSSTEEKALSARLSILLNEAAILTALGEMISASSRIRSFLAVPRPGVSISNVAYTPATTIQYKNSVGTIPGTIAVSGTAATRDALRTYQLALQKEPFATSVNLPVSAYAQDANISFTITVTLSL
ncbi:hypothetical protein A3A36_02625 [Candidatus Kaiserbacteria bacterium RIFCSPLOWO2_01_FULL_52_12b]|uniref:Uncharacterized protein n=1 Tax=Candidatus Kaiserbacteria bacterium RIFCSPLOWO2_01_FULL_52_12b TaxID=1798509 RepID=A0A1F6EWP6_9BACT|nr:MAG: hypothetical protein A3A36_02625 [Candidatus Kaiserbacteria bacterium RIFCSPLOWO2_01_FULL_52_12b]